LIPVKVPTKTKGVQTNLDRLLRSKQEKLDQMFTSMYKAQKGAFISQLDAEWAEIEDKVNKKAKEIFDPYV
jgi:hypothetical protein